MVYDPASPGCGPQNSIVGLARALVRSAGSQLPTPPSTESGPQMT